MIEWPLNMCAETRALKSCGRSMKMEQNLHLAEIFTEMAESPLKFSRVHDREHKQPRWMQMRYQSAFGMPLQARPAAWLPN